ncbi:hypothetical protein ES703_63018 [subsurface metagenome]
MGLLKFLKGLKNINSRIKNSFKKIRVEISGKATKQEFKDLKIDTEKNKEKIARLEGAVAVLMSQSQVSKSQPVSISLKKSRPKIEDKIINRIRRSKRGAVMEEIKKLMPTMSIIEIKNILVDEKGLCSKASYYRYVESLKSQSQVSSETKVRQKA